MKLSRFKSIIWALSFLSVAYASPSHAVIVYDTITGSSFNNGYWPVGPSAPGPFSSSTSAGVQFTATVAGYIDSLTLSLHGGTSADVYLFSDDSRSIVATSAGRDHRLDFCSLYVLIGHDGSTGELANAYP